MLPALRSPTFVDASAWIAAVNRRDRHHETARALLEAAVARGVQLVTTTWTAYEALSLLKSRAGPELAAELWALLTNPEAVVLVRVTEEVEASRQRGFRTLP